MSYFWNNSVFSLVSSSVLTAAAFGAVLSGGLAFAETAPRVTTAAAESAAAVTPAAPVDAAGAALLAALTADPSFDAAVRTFYQARGYRAFWSEDPSRADALAKLVATAPLHALPTDHYRLPVPVLGQGNTGDALVELARTKAFLTFAGDLAAGVLKPRALDREIHIFPERPENAFLLQEVARLGDPALVAARVQPSHPYYARVQKMLVDLNVIIEGGDWGPAVADGGTLKRGDNGPRVAALRARLTAMGDMTGTSTTDPLAAELFDTTLELGVMSFQRRHGLNADGAAGRRTLAAVNVTAAQRRDQAVSTLERMRWINKDLGAEHIVVNLADFRVNVIRNGVTLFDERVVVGKNREHRTPEFSDLMTYLVLNPTWNVPRSIAVKEILPELQANPNYLAEKNMKLIGINGAVPPEPMLADWSLYDRSSFPFRIKQNSGDGNALGKVKFMFPNDFSIYLHDTPSKKLFAKDARAFSHGCVRVQDPLALARILLAPKYDDPDAAIERILEKGDETYINLVEPIPVHLIYRTAWVDDGGIVQFRADVYGRDALIRSALGELGVPGRPGA